MNELTNVFRYGANDVRTVVKGEEIWFVAKDVCEVLEIRNTTDALKRLDSDEVTRFNLGGLSGEINIVNEPGLYSLILGSRKAEAKQFKRWITHEVIPSIRKHGAYMTKQTLEQALTSPDFLIDLATRLKEEQTKRIEAEQTIKENLPKVLFADSVASSKTSILVGELAKLLKQNGVEMGQKRLFAWLRDKGYLIKRYGTDYNMPTQKSMELELFEIKETSITHSDGHISVNKTPKVTGKGQMYFINKFLNKAN
ncbi:anti-repressor protein [Bacillus oleivorans]|uniref:Anti-repressor protein n=1 Tax=Bacillus oleivorans TaxID=1448271 RepID=A0A285CXL4_9BACI|nr:phage antirepressor [Bacillus oleivorans]SNX72279.1 anti-repressor protein [Bacillus oleivorans]